MKTIDISTFRFRRNPMLDYSIFDPIDEAEWLRLEAALDKDGVLLNLRTEACINPGQPHLTTEIGRTDKGKAVLFTAYALGERTGWFAGVAWSDAGAEQYRAHAGHRVEFLQSGDGTMEILVEKGKRDVILPKKGPRHQPKRK